MSTTDRISIWPASIAWATLTVLAIWLVVDESATNSKLALIPRVCIALVLFIVGFSLWAGDLFARRASLRNPVDGNASQPPH